MNENKVDIRRKNFGKLIVALRKEHNSIDNGASHWRQGDLAKRSSLSKAVIGKLERGERSLDVETLTLLANALQLTTLERREFFFASTLIHNQQISQAPFSEKDYQHKKIKKDLLDLLDKIELPAFINDIYGDIIAANANIVKLLNISPEFVENAAKSAVGHNIMSVVFSDDSGLYKLMSKNWEALAATNMHYFRYITLRYRADSYFQNILKELLKYPRFLKQWERNYYDEKDNFAIIDKYEYRHPNWGSLNYIANISKTFTIFGELYLVVYIPTHRDTFNSFRKISENLSKNVSQRVIPLASWPQKTITPRY